MSDSFSGSSLGLSAPLVLGFPIIPSDTNPLPHVTRQIRVTGQAGLAAVKWVSGEETVEPVAAGETLDWRIVQVKATGTTATGLRGYA